MANKIDGVGQRPVQVTGRDGKPQVQRPETDKPQQESTVDTVKLTDSAKQLRQLEEILANQPAVDTKRVEEIKEAIASGEYEINAERIAEKLLQLDKELGRAE